MPDAFTSSPDDLTLALTDTLRAALEVFPQLVLDAEQLASRLAPGLSIQLAEAAEAAGVGRSCGTSSPSDPSGRTPGVSPDSLASLTGLSHSVLGPTVGGLIQAGELVRDGWLVRLPQAEDLLPSHRLAVPNRGGELRHASERRAIGDRRSVGERRLFDRREPS